MSELVLGTAQWGLDYGVTNSRGRLSDEDVRAIVAEADGVGVAAIDTALAYGDAQGRIAPFADRFWISTKVPGVGDVSDHVGLCLEQLRLTRVDAVMLHDWDLLDDAAREVAVATLGACVADGLIGAAGVSVYGCDGVESAVSVFHGADVPLGIIQVPCSAIDRRLDACDAVRHLHASGCIVQVRSVFLQGLLAAPGGGKLHSHPDVIAFHAWAVDRPGGSVGAAIAHARSLPWVSQVVVGATSVSEWVEVCTAWRGIAAAEAPEHLASKDEVLLDPRRW